MFPRRLYGWSCAAASLYAAIRGKTAGAAMQGGGPAGRRAEDSGRGDGGEDGDDGAGGRLRHAAICPGGGGGAADGAAAYVMEGLPLGGRGDEIGGFDAGRLAMR